VKRELLKKVKRVVIKIGSAVITHEDFGLNFEVLFSLARSISELKKQGIQVLVVSSGAIACGRLKVGLNKNLLSLSEKQALAAVGQGALMQAYEDAFEKYRMKVAQVLLTADDLSQRSRYLNAVKTLNVLLKWGVVPIINENDTVASEEIRFGDNDLLSALVAGAIESDFLMVLSDVDALYSRDPREDPSAERIKEVLEVNEEIFKMAGKKPGRVGRGGMYSKLLAAKMVTSMGIPMVLLPGRINRVIEKFWQGEDIGTFFYPQKRELPMRKLWIKYYIRPEGRLFVDKGAEHALVNGGKSLLIAGVIKVEGDFPRGGCVECLNQEGRPVAKGLTAFSSSEIKELMASGKKADREVIHRDNLVLLD